MSTTTIPSVHVAPEDVHAVLSRHLLVDGYHLVLDLRRSHGSYLYDLVRGREVLDFFGSFSTCPVGYNHPKLDTPEFRSRILPSALNKPANSDIYTPELAEFVETFSRTVPPAFRELVKRYYQELGNGN